MKMYLLWRHELQQPNEQQNPMLLETNVINVNAVGDFFLKKGGEMYRKSVAE